MYTRTTQIHPQKQIIYKHISKSKTKKREDQNKKREHITQGGFSSSSSVLPAQHPPPPARTHYPSASFFFCVFFFFVLFPLFTCKFFPKRRGIKTFWISISQTALYISGGFCFNFQRFWKFWWGAMASFCSWVFYVQKLCNRWTLPCKFDWPQLGRSTCSHCLPFDRFLTDHFFAHMRPVWWVYLPILN